MYASFICDKNCFITLQVITVCLCMCMYVHACMCMYVHVCVCVYVYLCLCVCVYCHLSLINCSTQSDSLTWVLIYSCHEI